MCVDGSVCSVVAVSLHQSAGGQPLLRQGGPISYEAKPSGLFCHTRRSARSTCASASTFFMPSKCYRLEEIIPLLRTRSVGVGLSFLVFDVECLVFG